MAEIAQMRGLLTEMGRVSANCAHVAEAPTKLEGGLVSGALKVWNEDLGLTSANYVIVQCHAILSVDSDRLPDAWRGPLLDLQTALRAASDGEFEMTSPNEEEAKRQTTRQ